MAWGKVGQKDILPVGLGETPPEVGFEWTRVGTRAILPVQLGEPLVGFKWTKVGTRKLFSLGVTEPDGEPPGEPPPPDGGHEEEEFPWIPVALGAGVLIVGLAMVTKPRKGE